MKSITLIALFLLTHSIGLMSQPSSPAEGQTMDSLDQFIHQKMEESGIIGLGAAVIVNKKIVWIEGFGYADLVTKKPFTSNTIMNIASISKTIVGVAIMRAVEEGKLSLDEDINTYLPFKVVNPYYPNERITLRNLATHTSSLIDRNSTYNKTYTYGGDSPVALGTFLASYFVKGGKSYSKKNFLDAKPGSYREYSNIAAGLAGYIVEVVTSEKLNEYTKGQIFEPLKMNNTGWFLSEIDLSNHSKQYSKSKNGLKTIPLYGQSTYPDGGLRSSVSELSKLFISLTNGGEYEGVRILKKSSVDEMLRFQFTTSNRPDNINLDPPNKNSGIFWATKRDVTMMGHSGTDDGVKTEMMTDLSKEIGVILFSNTGYSREILRGHFAIFDKLWEYGQALRDAEK